MKLMLRFLLALLIPIMLLVSTSGYAFAKPRDNMVRVIIGFDKPTTSSEENKVRSYGGKINQRFHIVPAITAEVPERLIPILRLFKGISYVELDAEVYALEQTMPWGIETINIEQTRSYNQGDGVRVAVIDTGIDLDHPDLRISGDVSFVSGTPTGNDDNGHGTHVAGIIAALDNTLGTVGAASQAELYAVKVLDKSGSGSWSSVISGIQWAVDNDMDIINMSLGSRSGSTALRNACDQAYAAGVLIVAAAGNDGSARSTIDRVIYPAKYYSVIAVGAVDRNLRRASFSSPGPAVEIAAPGVDIYSTYKNGDYSVLSGTSMASPHVAGVAALIIASGITDTNNGRINDEVRARLQETAYDLGNPGRDREFGFGLVDAAAAVPVPSNQPPVADAGDDQIVFINTPVTLDGSGSYDPDGDTLTYHWTQIDQTPVILSDAYISKPSFTPFSTGTYTFQLEVNDGEFSMSDRVAITVRAENTPPTQPVVSISPSDPKTGDDLVCSISTLSTDADGDAVTYSFQWYCNTVLQNNLTSSTVASSYTTKDDIWLCVVTPSDGFAAGNSGTAQSIIINTAPVANSGPDQASGVNTPVNLNGSSSSDADNDPLSYSWVQVGGPSVDMSINNTPIFTFTPTSAGTYSFELTVNDGNESSTDSVAINVSEEPVFNIHVEDVTLTLVQRYGGSRTYALAYVTVYDSSNNPVSDVSVRGYWSDATSGVLTKTTGSNGQVSFTSSSLRYPASGVTYTFTVENLIASGWTYDSASNIESSGSVSVP